MNPRSDIHGRLGGDLVTLCQPCSVLLKQGVQSVSFLLREGGCRSQLKQGVQSFFGQQGVYINRSFLKQKVHSVCFWIVGSCWNMESRAFIVVIVLTNRPTFSCSPPCARRCFDFIFSQVRTQQNIQARLQGLTTSSFPLFLRWHNRLIV